VVLLHGHRIRAAVDGAHSLPMVFDMCDAASPRLRNGLRHAPVAELPWRLFRYWQIQRMELTARDRTSHIAFISARDRDAVMSHRSDGTVVPNGVDLEYWKPNGGTRQSNMLLFTGILDYPPNADAALYLVTHVLPEVRRVLPDVELVLAGRNPLPVLVHAARSRPGVTVTGFVNDLRPWLERAAVFVAPLRFASGMQNKLLEAMAMELPVVTTPVAADGLRVAGAEPPVRIGENAADLAAAVVALLRDSGARRQFGVNGREFVSRHFNWEHSAQLLERMCLDAIACASTEPASARKVGPLCPKTP
jgi:glycosyltransferase involved in cell wall biosynthesis